MIELKTPRGLSVNVPETESEDPSPKFDARDSAGIKSYYDQNGYVIVRSLFQSSDCERIRELWDKEVKPSREFIYRQATAKAEKHVFNSKNWVMNPILNLQSVDPEKYPGFRAFATKSILAANAFTDVFRVLFAGESPKIVQSMYFEGNSATWEHQDSYYLDSERIGSMAAAWIAIEDIHARAGRFFISPGSHNIDLGKQSLANNIADGHESYIQSVVAKTRELNLQIRAPLLEKGDVLFWNAWTIHGSLDSQDLDYSRSSITCHAIPDSHRFLQLQTRLIPLQLDTVNGVRIHRPKDLACMPNRAIFWLETHFPSLFYGVKKRAIKTLLWLRERRDRTSGLTS
ncbi:MAG TPA: phytanoyl-CoA dioxygenase family protein [Methylocella sp.]|nr:phytanoyl-CoA dioxygenase family protein [Methylocella sp.]